MSNVYYCATVTQNPTSRFTGEVGWRGTLRGLGKFSSEPILFEINIPGVHTPSNGKDS